jgi:3-oxoadipate enol-lactonase
VTVRVTPTGVGYERHRTIGPWETSDEIGLPVVFQHGLGVNRQVWLPWLHRMGGVARDAVLVDMRGHGASEWNIAAGAVTLDGFANDLVAVLDAEGIEKCHLIGESFGGTVCLYVGARHTNRIQSVTVCSTGWKGIWINNVPGWKRILDEEGVQAWSDALSAGRFGVEAAGTPLARWVRDTQERMDPSVVWAIAECLLGVDLEPELKSLTQPVLSMLAHSPFVDQRNIVEFVARVPHAENIRIPNARHGIVMTNVDECAAAAAQFIARAEQARS